MLFRTSSQTKVVINISNIVMIRIVEYEHSINLEFKYDLKDSFTIIYYDDIKTAINDMELIIDKYNEYFIVNK